MGYGTPYLLSLGLSEQLTSLVWLAGPISGLIAQPLIGAISDSSTSKYRRRYWIVTATILLVFSALSLAFTEPLAQVIVDLFGGGQGDWDPRHAQLVSRVNCRAERAGEVNGYWYCGVCVLRLGLCSQCVSGATVFILMASLQGSLRNLVLDIVPGEQLATANAWQGRFSHIGNIVGFTMGTLQWQAELTEGFLNLSNVPVIRLLGGGQFRKGESVSSSMLRRSLRRRSCHSCLHRVAHLLDAGGGRKGEHFRREEIVSVLCV